MDETIVRTALVSECRRLHENSQHTATAHFISAARLRWAHLFVLGPLPILLGALGSWSGWKLLLEDGAPSRSALLVSSMFALLAGITGGILSFLSLPDLRQQHARAGTLFKSLEHDLYRTAEIYAHSETTDALQARVESLGKRFNEANETSIQTSDSAMRAARKRIRAGIFRTAAEKKRRASDGAPAPQTTPSG